jgi:hypothetical protein
MNNEKMDAVLHEWLVLRPVFDDLVAHVCQRNADPRTVHLDDVLLGLNRMTMPRFAALVFAHWYGDTPEEAAAIADEVLTMMRDGKRPRRTVDMLPPDELAALRATAE